MKAKRFEPVITSHGPTANSNGDHRGTVVIEHNGERVEVLLYGGKLKLRWSETPAVLSQAYLTGLKRKAIVELTAVQE